MARTVLPGQRQLWWHKSGPCLPLRGMGCLSQTHCPGEGQAGSPGRWVGTGSDLDSGRNTHQDGSVCHWERWRPPELQKKGCH